MRNGSPALPKGSPNLRIRRLLITGYVLLHGVLFSAPTALAGNRVVAWGDLNYDLMLNPSGAAIKGNAAISAGDFHSLALNTDGSVLAWGDDRYNQTNLPALVRVALVSAIAAGNVHNLALMADGSVIAWGPTSGQPGDYGQCAVPAGLGPVLAVAAGAVHSMAMKPDGTVAAWGANSYGQCNVPSALSHVVAIAGGMYHSLALKSDGTVVSWGAYGLAQSSPPAGLSNVVAIATGDYHSLALKNDSTVVAWGFNTASQCSLPPGLTNIIAIAARGSHSMALIPHTLSTSRILPTLSIGLSDGNVVVSWPAAATGFELKQSTGLNTGVWTTVTNIPIVANSQNQVTLPALGAAFFRLVSQ